MPHARFSTVATPLRLSAAQRRVDRMGLFPGDPGVLQDRDRGADDQRALDDGGEELDLVVAVRVVRVGGARGQVEGGEGDDRGGDVDDAFEGIGEQRGARVTATRQRP